MSPTASAHDTQERTTRTGAHESERMVRSIVIGLGSPDRGDDAAGLIVARALAGRVPPGVELREVSGDPLELLELWTGHEEAIVIDAVDSGAPAGTVHRFDGRHLPGPESVRLFSTHAWGLREAIGLAQALDRLPATLVVIGIEARHYARGDRVSETTRDAVDPACRFVLKELVRQEEEAAKEASLSRP